MVEMTCEEHDRQAASTQFITHTVGRILGTMDLQVRPCSLGKGATHLCAALHAHVAPWLAAAACKLNCLCMCIAACTCCLCKWQR